MKVRDVIKLYEEEGLLPNQSTKKDLEMLRKIKALNLVGDKAGVNSIVNRINKVRKAEGLEELSKEEIIGKSTKQDVKRIYKEKGRIAQTQEKEKVKSDEIVFEKNKYYIKDETEKIKVPLLIGDFKYKFDLNYETYPAKIKSIKTSIPNNKIVKIKKNIYETRIPNLNKKITIKLYYSNFAECYYLKFSTGKL